MKKIKYLILLLSLLTFISFVNKQKVKASSSETINHIYIKTSLLEDDLLVIDYNKDNISDITQISDIWKVINPTINKLIISYDVYSTLDLNTKLETITRGEIGTSDVNGDFVLVANSEVDYQNIDIYDLEVNKIGTYPIINNYLGIDLTMQLKTFINIYLNEPIIDFYYEGFFDDVDNPINLTSKYLSSITSTSELEYFDNAYNKGKIFVCTSKNKEITILSELSEYKLDLSFNESIMYSKYSQINKNVNIVFSQKEIDKYIYQNYLIDNGMEYTTSDLYLDKECTILLKGPILSQVYCNLINTKPAQKEMRIFISLGLGVLYYDSYVLNEINSLPKYFESDDMYCDNFVLTFEENALNVDFTKTLTLDEVKSNENVICGKYVYVYMYALYNKPVNVKADNQIVKTIIPATLSNYNNLFNELIVIDMDYYDLVSIKISFHFDNQSFDIFDIGSDVAFGIKDLYNFYFYLLNAKCYLTNDINLVYFQLITKKLDYNVVNLHLGNNIIRKYYKEFNVDDLQSSLELPVNVQMYTTEDNEVINLTENLETIKNQNQELFNLYGLKNILFVQFNTSLLINNEYHIYLVPTEKLISLKINGNFKQYVTPVSLKETGLPIDTLYHLDKFESSIDGQIPTVYEADELDGYLYTLIHESPISLYNLDLTISPDKFYTGPDKIYKNIKSMLSLDEIKALIKSNIQKDNRLEKIEITDFDYVGNGNVQGIYKVKINYNDKIFETVEIEVSDLIKADYIYGNTLYFTQNKLLSSFEIVSDMKNVGLIPNINLTTSFNSLNDLSNTYFTDEVNPGIYSFDVIYNATSGESGTATINLQVLESPKITTEDKKEDKLSEILAILIIVIIIIIVIYLIFGKKRRYKRR